MLTKFRNSLYSVYCNVDDEFINLNIADSWTFLFDYFLDLA